MMAKKRAPSVDRSDATGIGSQPKSDRIERAASVASAVQIKAILMAECHASRAEDTYDPANSLIDLGIEGTEIQKVQNSEEFNVKLRMFLRAYAKGDSERSRALVEIRGTFVLVYTLPTLDAVADEELTAFSETSGVYSVWPYWREFVQATCLRMLIPPIILSTYRL